MLGHYFLIQIVEFHKIWILKYEIGEELSPIGFTLLELLVGDTFAFHYAYVIFGLGRNDEYRLVDLIQIG